MLKLRETPKALNYQAADRKTVVARLIASGMVTTLRDRYYGQSAAKPLPILQMNIWGRFRD